MKSPSPQKTALLMATAIASLALSAQGGPNPAVSSARQNRAKNNTLVLPNAAPTLPLAGTLWYNGDFEGQATGNGLTNEDNTSNGRYQYSHIYDDFIVPSGGFDINSIFSNNLLDTNVTGATWEVRQGVSVGIGGVLIASGMTVAPIVTLTRRGGFGYDEYMVEVPGLNLHLFEGTYWLNVTPVGDLTGRSFNSTTSGENCVGTPCGDDSQAFLDSNFYGYDFVPTENILTDVHDFSMGIRGRPGNDSGFLLMGAVSLQQGFAVFLPTSGPSGVEDRVGARNTKYKIRMTFNETISSVGTASTTCGSVTSTSISGNTVTVSFLVTGRACDQSEITITLTDVVGEMGDTLSLASVMMGLLGGDVNGDGYVDRTDGNLIGRYFGQTTDDINFRADIDSNGVIDSNDADIVKHRLGNSLP